MGPETVYELIATENWKNIFFRTLGKFFGHLENFQNLSVTTKESKKIF